MNLNGDSIVDIFFVIGIACILYGFIGLTRKKITFLHRNHALEGKGAVLFSLLFIMTGIGVLLTIFA